MSKVFIKTFGCKVNYTESVSLADLLREAGINCTELTGAQLREPGQRPVVFVNTCCVTQEAERKAGQFIRRIQREHPTAEVLVCGCGARRDNAQEVFLAAGARVFSYYPEAFEWLKAHLTTAVLDQAGNGLAEPALPPGRVRSFIKVQDGCYNCCGYCIVPFVRRYASRPLSEITKEVTSRLAAGYRELVLTGINLGHYGQEPVMSLEESTQRADPRAKLYAPIKGHPSFDDLVAQLLDTLPTGTRLRISSLEPEEISPRFFELLAHPRLCPHLHLPLQSGSDAVLKAMRRRYTVAEYVALVRKFRSVCPTGALTTDLISGFPTEQEEDVQATMQLVTELGFERVHGFPFSPRPKTPAGELTQLPKHERQSRNRHLIAHAQTVADERWQRFLGQRIEVLIEEPSVGGWLGHGPAYQIVKLTGTFQPGQLLTVELSGYQAGQFSGRVVS